MMSLRLSPDGAKLAYKAGDPTTDIWVDELARGVHIRLTNDPGITTAVLPGRPTEAGFCSAGTRAFTR